MVELECKRAHCRVVAAVRVVTKRAVASRGVVVANLVPAERARPRGRVIASSHVGYERIKPHRRIISAADAAGGGEIICERLRTNCRVKVPALVAIKGVKTYCGVFDAVGDMGERTSAFRGVVAGSTPIRCQTLRS